MALSKSELEEIITRVESAQHAAATARRAADDAMREARNASNAAATAEQVAEWIAKDLGAVWATMTEGAQP